MAFRIRAGKKGLALRLHELEAEIMDTIWAHQLSDFAVSEVVTLLEKKREIAYTTVMTTLARLHEKELLSRKKEGKRYLYSATVSREEFLESTAREVLHGAVEPPRALAMLSERVSDASSSELDELEDLIRRRRKELDS